MIRLATLIDTFESAFLAKYGNSLLPGQRQALAAMKQCRTAHSRRMLAQCDGCDAQRCLPHSCGHRLCPHCQHHESQQWLERQLQKRVPAEYFLLTFTLPAEFRPLAWQHRCTVFEALMQSAWATLSTFCRNDKQMQGTPGAAAVLHTHSRRLDFHPHVHVLMPAAAVDLEQRRFRKKTGKRRCGSGYLFPHKALAKMFRAKMLAALTAAGLALPAEHPRTWVVDCKSVGNGDKALVYLGRYLYRGVLQEKDILACRDGRMTFRYCDSKTGKYETRTLAGEDFLWLLLQHVLPKGFRRARNFGFLHPNCRRMIQLLHLLLRCVPSRPPAAKPRPPILCSCCGGTMRILRTRLAPLAPPPTEPPGPGAETGAM